MTDERFAELQARLRAVWPAVALRSIGDVERTVVVVHSISFDVPDQLVPVFPAYEERSSNPSAAKTARPATCVAVSAESPR
jgi:hypothetical protein